MLPGSAIVWLGQDRPFGGGVMADSVQKRFNILFVVTDQEYAHQAIPEGVSLPNHERLRASGVTFMNQQVTTTVCTPSRSVMLTGQHTPHTGMWDNTNMA